MINCTVHLLFLVESLLLKKAVPVLKPNIRPRRLHLVAEEFRPWGCQDALAIAKMIIEEDPGSYKELEKLIKTTLIRSVGQPDETIRPDDIEHVHDLLPIIARSGLTPRWGEGREFHY
jgi:hypothetical protein